MKKLIVTAVILVLALNAALLLSSVAQEAKAARKCGGFTTGSFGGKTAEALVLPSLIRF